MLRTIELQDLRAQIALRGDLNVAGSGARHLSAELTDLINDSQDRYWQELGTASDWATKLGTATTSGGTGSTQGWDDDQHVVLATDVLVLKGVSIFDGTQWLPMEPFDLQERDDYDGDYFGTNNGLPLFFRVTLNDAKADILWLSPRADAAYDIRYWYHQAPTVLVNDDDELSYYPGTLDYIICDVALRLLARDGNPEPGQTALLVAQRDEALNIAKRMARERNRSGPKRRQSTRETRARHRAYATGPWRRV